MTSRLLGEDLLPLEAIATTDLSNPAAVQLGALSMERMLLGDAAGDSPDLSSVLDEGTLERLQGLYEKFETDLEYEFAHKILSGEAELEDYPLHERFVRLIEAESKLADIKPDDTVLFIGSGPLPISPILFARITGASVVCYDISSEAIETSEQVIEKLDLSEKIKVFNSSGEQGDCANYDAVVIALLAHPKDKIALNVKWSNPENTPVVVRFSSGSRKVFYKGLEPQIVDKIYRTSLDLFPSGQQHRGGLDDTVSSTVARVDKTYNNR